MFDYTQVALEKTKKDFHRYATICSVTTQIFYIAYLIYSLIVQNGLWFINAAMLVFALAYFVFFLVVTLRDGNKRVKAIVKTIFTRCKQAVKLFSLGVALYSIYLTAAHATPFSVLLTALMIVGFVLGIVIELIEKIVVGHFNLFVDAIKGNIEPVTKVVGFFKKSSQDDEALPIEKEPSKHRRFLDEKVAEFRAKREEKKRLKKIAEKENKQQEKIAKAEEKKRLKQSKKALPSSTPSEETPQETKKQRKKKSKKEE